MSKAEERARDLGYRKDPLNRAEYTANDEWDAFIDGYHQAEKDLELGWEDMRRIYLLVISISDMQGWKGTDMSIYKEVLKRFKDLKK